MGFLWWSIIILSFILSLVGIIVPVIPSILFLWGGFLVYHFFIDNMALGSVFWWGMAVITVFLLVADYVLGAYFVQKYKGSKWSILGSILGMLIFPFIIGPIGIIVGPFVSIFLIELLLGRTTDHSFKVALGSFFSLISSTFLKGLVQIGMIIWFFVAI